MVSTRRSGATEPLERLETPPKRTQSTNSTSTASTKRRHEETEIESLDNATPSKKLRIEEAAATELWSSMFAKPSALEDEDLSRTPKSFADSIRRKKNLAKLTKQAGRYSSLPRQSTAPRSITENPFGIKTFSEQELNDARAARQKPSDAEPNDALTEREERSAAPEPETPRRGLFGSLRDIGSATIGRVFSPFSKGTSTPQAATVPHPRTEPSKRIAAWDIHYPQIEPVQEDKEESDSDKKRRTFEEKHGRTDRKYDHLHTTPAEGEQEKLPFPVKKTDSKPKSTDDAPPSIAAFAQRRRERRNELGGQTPPRQPQRAPLFGPNSHFVRGTKDPVFQTFFEGGDHPAMRPTTGNKRTLEEALPEEAQAQNAPPRSFRPHVEEDDEEDADITQDAPSTPAAKKQKTSEKSALQTPRSALKIPGSIGRSGKSARFNQNPVASIKRMSPSAGSAPAGLGSPNSLFQPFSTLEEEIPASNSGLTPSPNTHKNTLANTGAHQRGEILFKQHPGDLFTTAINEGMPSELRGKRVPYVWKDPQDPSWKPSLFNPRPGTFRLLDDDEIEEEQQYLNQMEQDDTVPPEGSAPDPPSTPRMSHAELPKAPAISAADSTSAFEAANLERRRADASKTKPRKASKLAEVTSARSRSPSPPPLDASDAADTSDESAKTPSPVMAPATGIWTWDSSTNEYLSFSPSYPDFAYNPQNELVPSFALKSSKGSWDNKTKGPDGRTELARQNYYKNKYNEKWANENFAFAPAQTYEEAAVGSRYIHELIRKNDARCPELVKKSDERFALEWDAHQLAIEDAMKEGKTLVAVHPDRDGIEMLDVEEDL